MICLWTTNSPARRDCDLTQARTTNFHPSLDAAHRWPDRDVVDHQMASRVNAAALEDAREDPRLIRRCLPPAESGAALLRNGGRGSFALGYSKK